MVLVIKKGLANFFVREKVEKIFFQEKFIISNKRLQFKNSKGNY